MIPLPLARRSLRNRRFSFLVFLAVIAGPALATPAFELNMDRVKVSTFGGSLSSSKTYFVPTVNLMISASGSVWAQSKNGSANAQAHAKFYVKGLDHAALQDLAKQLQDDLVAKLRAGGYTVLTYDDLKASPEVSGQGREHPDSKWQLPTKSQEGLTYVIATPSDEQAFDRPIQGPLWPLRNLMKQKDLIVLVPDITLNVPIVYGQKGGGYKRADASVIVNPGMLLKGAMIWTANRKGSANILVQEHGKRLVCETAGTVGKLSEDKTNFTSSWGRSSADYVFTLDAPAFSSGVLRVGSVINSMIVAQIAKSAK